MTVKTAHFSGTDWSDGDVLFAADLNDTFGEVGAMGLASGTITLQTTTTAYDVDFADVSIAAGALTANDIIVIELVGSASDQAVIAQLGINDVTSTGTLFDSTIITASDTGWTTFKVRENPTANDVLVGTFASVDSGSTVGDDVDTHDTNDANVMTTAFTIRINLRQGSSASANSPFNYTVYAVKR